MKTIVPIVSFLFMGCVGLSAQTFEVPENYHLNVKTDYEFYEPVVVKCVDWLIATPIDQEQDKRKAAYKFLLQWCIGSPTVHINVNTDIIFDIRDERVPNYLLIFMGGFCTKTLLTKSRRSFMELTR